VATRSYTWFVLALLTAAIAVPAAQSLPSDRLAAVERAFRDPPADARIMMRWWWFGPAVEKDEIARELRIMREAGIGGVEIQPVYPLTPDEEGRTANLPFLSREFLEAIGFAAEAARERGMRVDVTLGSGWPYGGPRTTIDRAAGKLRIERVPVAAGVTRVPLPPVGAGERLLRLFVTTSGGDGAAAREVTVADLSAGEVAIDPGATDRVLLCFISSRTGMQVKRAAVGAEGFVLDHYDRAALDAHLTQIGEPLVRAFGAHPPTAVFCDSLEVFGSDWTGDLLAEFERRRGYDVAPLLPRLAGDTAPLGAGLRYDWGRTLSELFEERFIAPLQAWAHAHGTTLRIQGYGTPHATLGSNRFADLPEGEGWQWKALRPSRWAASAAHLHDRPVVSSETWTWLHSPTFRATPLDMKAEADLHFLQGITQIVGHGWPYSPPGAEYPGWHFYAAGAFDDRNPWFFAMPELAAYLQRVSAVLRQGSPVTDVGLYLPVSDAWSALSPERMRYLNDMLRERIGDATIARTIEAGFALDFFDDDVLRRRGSIEDGALRLGSSAYGIVILPNVEHMPIETARALEAFAARGGAVVATARWPSRAPGRLATEDAHARVRAHLAAVARSPRARLVTDVSTLGPALRELMPPDIRVSTGADVMGFVHRRLADADVYFVANTSPLPLRTSTSFRVPRSRGEAWDPASGTVDAIAIERDAADRSRVTVPLRLEPYESRIVVFSDRAARQSVRPHRIVDTIDVSGGWRVKFGEGGLETSMPRLESWTAHAATRHFSGVATYEREVELPAAALAAEARVFLDFGDGRPGDPPPPGANGFQVAYEAPVRDAAEVFVNAARAGVAWRPPYVVEMTSAVRPGVNQVRVRVGNLLVNALAGRARPSFRLLTLRYGERFVNQDEDRLAPVTAGLLGPIRLIVRR
jgi:hypothetical protein